MAVLAQKGPEMTAAPNQGIEFAERLRQLVQAYEKAGEGEDPGSLLPESAFHDWARALAAWQAQTIPLYRSWWEQQGKIPERIDSWRQIPPLPVQAFAVGEVTALFPEQRLRYFLSSGTTSGQRSRHFHSPESLKLYETVLWPPFQRHLLPPSAPPIQKAASLTPPLEQVPESSLVHMIHTVMKQMGVPAVFFGWKENGGSWGLDCQALASFLDRVVMEQSPVLLLGTAFAWVHFLDFLEREGRSFQLPWGSRLMETGGYKGRSRELTRSELFQRLSVKLGIPSKFLVGEYGMCELSSQAYDQIVGRPETADRPENRIYRFPPWVRIRVLSPETGEDLPPGQPGLLALCDLANVWSVACLLTQDLVVGVDAFSFRFQGRSPKALPRGCSLFFMEEV